ncbi:hypothetical protein [Dactylosporangium sp. CA-139066]|uniref:hypothetical protein n=1 Tax=Dactylosporangium sp. CA-139066 TaxID=3239930 RepID=UPI003D938ECC
MSDFDEVLERLLGDPAFKARLAADPQGALAGYQLTPDELDILQSQIGEAGGQAHVEQRTSKASMFGVFSAIGSGLDDVLHGGGHGHGFAVGHGVSSGGAEAGRGMHDVVEQYGGRHTAPEPTGAGGHGGLFGGHMDDIPQGGRHAGIEEVHTESSHTEYHHESHRESGTVYRSSGYTGGGVPHEAPTGAESVGSALSGGGGQDVGAALPGGGAQGVASGLAGYSGVGTSGGGIGAGLGDLAQHAGQHHGGGIGGGLEGLAQHVGHGQVPGQAPTDGYHTRVDWDGDGRWDQHTYVNRADGGVDIVVDTDGDGRAEFIGHDTNRDGLIDSSEIDTNHDGVMDARYEDTNGDGWLDRRTR